MQGGGGEVAVAVYQAGGGNADGIFSLVLKKDPQGWKIILDHSNRTN